MMIPYRTVPYDGRMEMHNDKITKKVVAFVMTVIILSAIIISGCSNQNKAQNDNVPVITWYDPALSKMI